MKGRPIAAYLYPALKLPRTLRITPHLLFGSFEGSGGSDCLLVLYLLFLLSAGHLGQPTCLLAGR